MLRSANALPFIVRTSVADQVNGETYISTDSGATFDQIVGDVTFTTVMLPSADARTEFVVGDQLSFGNAINGSIHGFKFEDADFDGVFDATETPLSGVTFRLTGTDGQGRVRDEIAVTNADGEFWFSGLVPSVSADQSGTGYTLTEIVPGGSLLSTGNNGQVIDVLSGQAIVWQSTAADLSATDPRTEVVANGNQNGENDLIFGKHVPRFGSRIQIQ